MEWATKSSDRISLLALGCVWLVALFLFILTHCISPLLPGLIIDFRLSHSMGGFLYALPVLMIALFSYPLGIFSDRIGMEASVCYGATIAVVFSLLRAFSPSFNLFALSTALFGLGFAFCLPNLPKLVKEKFPPHLAGTATGAYTTAIPFAGGLAMAFTIPLLGATGSWRSVILVWSLMALPGIILWWFVSRLSIRQGVQSRPVNPEGPQCLPSSGKGGLTSSGPLFRRLAISGLLLALLNLIFYCTIGWLPTYLTESGWAAAKAAGATSVISFVEIPAMFFMPALADRTGSRRLIIILSFLLMAVCSATVAASPSLCWFTIPFFGITMGGVFSLLLTIPVELVERERVGRAAGAIISMGYIGSLIGPPVTGYLRDLTGNFSLAFLVTAFVGVVAATFSCWLPKPHSNPQPRKTG